MNRVIAWLVGIIAIGLVCWVFPLFHVVPLREAEAEKRQAAFNAAEFAKAFWDERLMKSLDKAADASIVVSEISNPKKAREQFGRSVGLSEAYYFFLRGSGRVVSVTPKGIGVSLKETGDDAEVLLPTGLLFGNAVRDATGLLDASAFPNSQNFNDISTELNRIIETQILPALKEKAVIGRRIEFVGCAEVADEEKDLKPLCVIPIQAEVK